MNVSLVPRDYDPEELYQLFRSAMEQYVNATRGAPWNDGRERRQFFEQFAPASVRLILVEGKVVGFVDVRADGDTRFLHTMIVAPNSQSKGIGTIVVGQLKLESNRLSLAVLKTNPRARAFYERSGFCEVSSTQQHYQLAWTSQRRVHSDIGTNGAHG